MYGDGDYRGLDGVGRRQRQMWTRDRCWAQKTFEFVKLDEESYYLSVAPIDVDWMTVAGLNVGTFLITLVFLVVPSYLVTRIDPVKAIRFK